MDTAMATHITVMDITLIIIIIHITTMFPTIAEEEIQTTTEQIPVEGLTMFQPEIHIAAQS